VRAAKTSYLVQFHTSPDGRPEIYDFLWEYLPELIEELNIDSVTINIERKEPFKNWGNSLHYAPHEFENLVWKFLHDKKFDYQAKLKNKTKNPKIEIKIPAEELDHVLNKYNILFELLMTDIQIRANGLTMDFDPSHKNSLNVILSSRLAAHFDRAIEHVCPQKPILKSATVSSKKVKK
jgi:hypothetical protein